MAWAKYTKSEKRTVILSSLGLFALLILFIWGMIDEGEKQEILKLRGKRTIGKVYDSYKSYKGGKRLKYYFNIGSTRYQRTEIRNPNYPTSIGDKRVVVYDPENPKSNRMLLHEPIEDSSDLLKYLRSPIIINP